MRCTTGLGLAALTVALGLAGPSIAQEPNIPNMAQRSGLIGRYVPFTKTNLPQDPDRDTFYGTRYGDRASVIKSNSPFGGGLYGQRLDPGCTTCINPAFNGAPGRSTAFCPHCQASHKGGIGRFVQSVVNPFKPVGRYYDRGCYVPIYDLDPGIPGPGPDLWPFYHNGFSGG